MKLLIYGSNGWIGSQFIEICKKQNIDYYEGKSRVDNKTELLSEIDCINPTHIISFIGRTHGKIKDKIYNTIDYLEQPGKMNENIRDNLFSPLTLAIICKNKNIHYTYLGTGCIFDYDENHTEGSFIGFNENSKPNFQGSSYSIVKGYTDQLMNEFSDNVLNLRIRMPIIGIPNKRNFITKITNYNRICSMQNSMSVLSELLPYILILMEENIKGTLNFTNPGSISHNEILNMYKEIVDPSFTWTNFTIEEQDNILDSKRSNNYLDTTLLEKYLPNVKNIKDSIRECLYEYKKYYQVPAVIKKEIEPNYQLKNLLVTGGCGFIGSNFINYYLDKNPNVCIINIDAMYYCANINNIKENHRKSKNYTMIKGNICSEDIINHILNFYKIDTVIHFAAQSHVCSSFTDSLQYTKDNILGTHILLESCRKYGMIQRFIHVSTDEVYGESMLDTNEMSKTEQNVLCPTNPYAATKAGAELIAQSYNHSFKMPIIITRGNNVYGPNQYPEKLIPRFIKLLKENKKVTIQGDGSCLRSFIHVDDTSKAFESILERGSIGEIYNIGGNEESEYSVLDIAKILIKKIQHTEEYNKWIEYVDDRPFNDKRYYISNDKLKGLGWNTEVDFENGVKQLVF